MAEKNKPYRPHNPDDPKFLKELEELAAEQNKDGVGETTDKKADPPKSLFATLANAAKKGRVSEKHRPIDRNDTREK